MISPGSVVAVESVDIVEWIAENRKKLRHKIKAFLPYASPAQEEEDFIQAAYGLAITVKPLARLKGISFDRFFWRAYHKVCCEMATAPTPKKLFGGKEVAPEACLYCGSTNISPTKRPRGANGSPNRSTGDNASSLICQNCQTAIPAEFYDISKSPCHHEEYLDDWSQEDGEAPSLGKELLTDYLRTPIEEQSEQKTYRLIDLAMDEVVRDQALGSLTPRQQELLIPFLKPRTSAQELAEKQGVKRQTIEKIVDQSFERIDRTYVKRRPLLMGIPRP